ncbi:MAG: hypothetical protein NTV63_03050 [Candidatus Woesearchaeota archaeon]|nr:hypothetical protein [Candidatus Woesearchaeota archaeon]
MPVFGKKDDSAPNAFSSPTVPVEQVINLRNQGLSNSQIVEMLQRDGYKTHQIFDAMNQADMSSSIQNRISPEQISVKNPIPDFNPDASSMQPQFRAYKPSFSGQNVPNPPEMPKEEEHYSAEDSGAGERRGRIRNLNESEVEKIEEISEAIIEEKWNEFIVNVNKIIAWKERTEARVVALEKRFDDLRGSFDELQRGLMGKVGEYDRHITEVGSEIKAMEKVFQKVLPSFTANVNELSRITTDIKEKRR